MASAGNLQPMPPFDPKMDISTVAQRWQQWLKRFKVARYSNAHKYRWHAPNLILFTQIFLYISLQQIDT